MSGFLLGRSLQLAGLILIAHYLIRDWPWGWALWASIIAVFGMLLEADAFMMGEDPISEGGPGTAPTPEQGVAETQIRVTVPAEVGSDHVITDGDVLLKDETPPRRPSGLDGEALDDPIGAPEEDSSSTERPARSFPPI